MQNRTSGLDVKDLLICRLKNVNMLGKQACFIINIIFDHAPAIFINWKFSKWLQSTSPVELSR